MQPQNSDQSPAIPPVAPLSNSPGPATSQPSQPSSQSSLNTGSVPDAADDGDLIEKEWVLQAKRVFMASAGNPFEQNRQFTKLKAEYMQKRYGKAIKSEE